LISHQIAGPGSPNQRPDPLTVALPYDGLSEFLIKKKYGLLQPHIIAEGIARCVCWHHTVHSP
jgi:hypothetical protein